MDLENLFQAFEESFEERTQTELNNTDNGMFVTL